MFAITLTTSETLMVAVPSALGMLGWMTWLSKMIWDIRTDVSVRSARQDTRLDDLEQDVLEIQNLLPRVVPH